jgi:hypothetical protein
MGHGLVYRWNGLHLMSDQTLMMGTEMVPEMSVIFKQLTHLTAQEDIISYIYTNILSLIQ